MKLTEMIALPARIPKKHKLCWGSVLTFREGRLEKSGKMDQKQGIPLLCRLESVQFCTRILTDIPCYLSVDIQLQFYCIIRKYSLKCENVN